MSRCAHSDLERIALFWIGLMALSGLLASCGLTPMNQQAATHSTSNNNLSNNSQLMSFATLQAQVLTPACMQCHANGSTTGGGIDLSTYNAVLTQVTPSQPQSSALYTAINSGTMPPSGPMLSSSQIQLVYNWIMQGAPNAAATPTPTPTPGGNGNGTSPPTITSITPNTGSTAGGTSVTITGTGFKSGAAVKFGSASCTGVTVASATQITCSTPAGTAGGSSITVTNSDGGTVTSSNALFTYTSAGGNGAAGTFTNVQQILNASCVACHNNNNAQKGVNYADYTTTKSTGQVVPNNPNQSGLYNTVNSGSMPQGAAKLSSASIQSIQMWIQNGALNN